MKKKVLSAGQCNFDATQIRGLLEPLGAKVEECSSASECKERVKESRYDLILLNRIFDKTGESGTDLIETLKTLSQSTIMLVSNYPEFQNQAQELGAVEGFGKQDIGSPEVQERLRKLLNEKTI
jgi:CheY-like chemotaxis protein